MKKEATFVYICRPGENEELRYSIRSVVKHFPDAKIWVVGEPPRWYDGDYIRVKQLKSKYENAYKNLMVVCSSPAIPDSFILMNDDFYIVRPVKEISYFHEGNLEDKFNEYYDAYPNSGYTRKLGDTFRKLSKKTPGQAPLSYELHVPFPVEKWKLIRSIKSENFLWRSVYGNTYEVGGEEMSDVKVYSTVKMSFKTCNYKKSKSPFLSSDDTSFHLLKKDVLDKKFPNPSKYEK
jgi:hypothetical protein